MASDWPCEFPGVNWFDKEEEKAVLDVVRRGAVFRFYGPEPPHYVTDLESRARTFYGSRHALAVGSGTGALCTAMAALGIGPGCEVIVPAFLWIATVGAVVRCNAIPVLCEVDETFNMDADDLARKITPRTRLIVAVHMAGAPTDMDAVMKIADRAGVPVLEDCAQCNGGSVGGKKVGTFGRVGIFSFQINKNVTAGEGGLIVTDDEELYWRLNASHDLGVPWKDGLPDEGSPVLTWGQGRRMPELTSAVVNVQLAKLPQIVAHMAGSKARIRQRLAQVPGMSLRRLVDPAGDTGPFLIFSCEDEQSARRTAHRLSERGVKNSFLLAEYGLHIYSNIRALVDKVPLSAAGNPWSLAENRESVYSYARGACPRSDDLFGRSVLVTIPSRLTVEQEQWLAQTIASAAEGTGDGQ